MFYISNVLTLHLNNIKMNEKIQKVFNSALTSKNSFGASLRVERGDGEVLFNSAGGNMDINTKYFIASTTKLFTTAIIFKLIFEKKLSLEDTLSKFLGTKTISGLNVFKGKDYSSQITIRQLLAHTSGIPDYFSGKDSSGKSLESKLLNEFDEKWDFDKSLILAKTLKANFYPGQIDKALYSDTNFQILGRIIEIIRKESIIDVYKKEIINLLNLSNTYTFTNSDSQNPLALYYQDKVLKIPLAMSSFGPDGGVVSTSEELMIFLKAFFQGKIFPVEYTDIMKSEFNSIFYPLKYGVGIMKFQMPRIFTMFKIFPPLLGHSGLSGAFAFYCVEKDLYITGTVNQIAARSRSYQMMIKVLQVAG